MGERTPPTKSFFFEKNRRHYAGNAFSQQRIVTRETQKGKKNHEDKFPHLLEFSVHQEPDELRNVNWLKNTTNIPVPEKVKKVLKFGSEFAFPILEKIAEFRP